MNFRIYTPYKNIYHLKFKTQYDVTSTMMRMQEFYESPYENIQGKVFTVEEYMDTYAQHVGNFTYFTDWAGFNIPGHIVIKFINLYKNQYIEKEKLLIKTIKRKILNKIETNKFYIIATYKNNSVLDHEIAHARYYLNDEYRQEINQKINLKKKIYKSIRLDLLNKGYNQDVIKDEIQAYLITSSKKQLESIFSEKIDDNEIDSLKQIYNKYF